MITAYAGNEKPWWVVFKDHHNKKRFFSSHDSETEAMMLASQQSSIAEEIAKSESATAGRSISPDVYSVRRKPDLVQAIVADTGEKAFENGQPVMIPDPNWVNEE